ncbi:MAG TPA: glycosyl hydrolase family 18 protein [Bacteroidales bacterium]|nr:glycosyl hydrolase family 18 protein [Bacteroidales bacterium]
MLQRWINQSMVYLCLVLPAGQLAGQHLIGYWHNWNDLSAPYIPLNQVDTNFSILQVAFAIPQSENDYDMVFVPDMISPNAFLSQLQSLQAQGKKVILSVGGATAPVGLDNTAERDTFISSMNGIVDQYGFDGIDMDLEGGSVSVSGGTIAQPTDARIINLIYAIREIMAHYRSVHGKKMMLTMAPETAFVQGGQSAYGSIWGAYLPLIHALRDSIDILHVQLYNSGSMYGIDGNIYYQGTADFIVAMTEAVIAGFNTQGGYFTGLPASRVAVGLPACSLAAGGGYTDTATVAAALRYLLGTGPKPGTYTLQQPGGFPDLGGMMTWSINWDAVPSCGGSYAYAENFQRIFHPSIITPVAENITSHAFFYPNPSNGPVHLRLPAPPSSPLPYTLTDLRGRVVEHGWLAEQKTGLDLSRLAPGMYWLSTGELRLKCIRR